MHKHSTLIKIDINGFNKIAQSMPPLETMHYLRGYYEDVFKEASELGWKFVKTIGDCVLLSAEESASHEDICALHDSIRRRFDINTNYRVCEFEESRFVFGDYSCTDTIGEDINNLFLGDSATVMLG